MPTLKPACLKLKVGQYTEMEKLWPNFLWLSSYFWALQNIQYASLYSRCYWKTAQLTQNRIAWSRGRGAQLRLKYWGIHPPSLLFPSSLPHLLPPRSSLPSFVTFTVMMYSCVHDQAPHYLMDFCHQTSSVASRQQLRSVSRRLLVVPRFRLSTTARRTFSVVGPSVWNYLPDYLRDSAVSRDTFRQHLKTFMFAAYRALEVSRLCAI